MHKTKPTRQLIQSNIYCHYYWAIKVEGNYFRPSLTALCRRQADKDGGWGQTQVKIKYP